LPKSKKLKIEYKINAFFDDIGFGLVVKIPSFPTKTTLRVFALDPPNPFKFEDKKRNGYFLPFVTLSG